jgi:hypothetical protein
MKKERGIVRRGEQVRDCLGSILEEMFFAYLQVSSAWRCSRGRMSRRGDGDGG